MPQGPGDVADPGRAQPQTLDHAHRFADVDDISHPVLVLDQHEHPREDVLDEILGTEPQRHPQDAGTGDERADVDAEGRSQDGDDGDRPHHESHHRRDHRAQGVEALHAPHRGNGLAVGEAATEGARRTLLEAPHQAPDQPAEETTRHPGDTDDEDHLEDGLDYPTQHSGGEAALVQVEQVHQELGQRTFTLLQGRKGDGGGLGLRPQHAHRA